MRVFSCSIVLIARCLNLLRMEIRKYRTPGTIQKQNYDMSADVFHLATREIVIDTLTGIVWLCGAIFSVWEY